MVGGIEGTSEKKVTEHRIAIVFTECIEFSALIVVQHLWLFSAALIVVRFQPLDCHFNC